MTGFNFGPNVWSPGLPFIIKAVTVPKNLFRPQMEVELASWTSIWMGSATSYSFPVTLSILESKSSRTSAIAIQANGGFLT